MSGDIEPTTGRSYKPTGSFSGMLFGLIWFCACGFGASQAAVRLYEVYEVGTDAVETVGTFVDRHIEPDSDGPDRYFVSFRYAVDDVQHLVRQRVERDVYNAAQADDVAPVFYAAQDVQAAFVFTKPTIWNSLGSLVLILLFSLFGLAMLIAEIVVWVK